MFAELVNLFGTWSRAHALSFAWNALPGFLPAWVQSHSSFRTQLKCHLVCGSLPWPRGALTVPCSMTPQASVCPWQAFPHCAAVVLCVLGSPSRTTGPPWGRHYICFFWTDTWHSDWPTRIQGICYLNKCFYVFYHLVISSFPVFL